MSNLTRNGAIQLVANLIVSREPGLLGTVNDLLGAFGQAPVAAPQVTSTDPVANLTKKAVKGRCYVVSSNIEFVEFKLGRRFDARRPKLSRRPNRVLVGFLNGSVYQYDGVSKETFEALATADSVGSYFSENIRDEYKTKKLKDAQSASA